MLSKFSLHIWLLYGHNVETSSDFIPPTSSHAKNLPNKKQGNNFGKSSKSLDGKYTNGHVSSTKKNGLKNPGKRSILSETSSSSSEDNSDDEIQGSLPERRNNGSNQKTVIVRNSYEKNGIGTTLSSFNLRNSEIRQDRGIGGMHIRASRSLQSKVNSSLYLLSLIVLYICEGISPILQ